MGEAMEFFKFILDNQQEMQKQVMQDVFNIIKTKDEKFNEYIMEELSHFDFSMVERDLISNIVSVIDSSLKPLDNTNESNYEDIKNNLINNLKILKLQDYKLENNFNDLSRKMTTKFSLPENFIGEFYSYFMSKSELIKETIQKINNNVIETLIKYSPNLIDEIEQSRNKAKNIDKKNEKVNNQMIDDLEPRINNETKPEGPTSPSVSTYIGATNEDVEKLIRANEYYSLLHGINRESFMRYNGFIQTGFNLITNDYYNRAASCNTLEERLKSLAELKEIYDNFNGYITMEQSNQLRETIENMNNYLQQEQTKQINGNIGIRYNGDGSREVRTGRHM